ncbi:MAG: adenylyltransferase/cytidyltransferase family protein [Pseudomonadota bacterium]
MKPRNPRLLSLRKAVALRKKIAAVGGQFVLTNGVFDLLHPGHISYLEAARRLGGRNGMLLVALNSDQSVRELKGKLRPVLAERMRAYDLSQLRSVDAVFVFRRKRLNREIEALKPDIYCKAGDYTIARLDPDERAALRKVGARIRFLPFLPGFSTTNLIARIKAAGEI